MEYISFIMYDNVHFFNINIPKKWYWKEKKSIVE